MRFLIFSDLHHIPEAFMGGTLEDLELFQKHAEETGCDFVIHAGDFCHGPSTIPEYLAAYNSFRLPVYHALGNHDTDRTPYEETLKLYNMPDGHYFFDCKGVRIIVMDPNYFLENGEYIHFSMANYAKYGAFFNFVPPEQLTWLEETIASSQLPCVIISHESFEREADGVKNQADVRRIINEANRRRPHSVLMCINGHYHRDFIRILDGVCYMEMNSASYDWLNNAHDLYPEELCKKHSLMGNTVVFNDPLHAVITIEGTEIAIEGMESNMFMGITREMTPNPPCDPAGRPATPVVQSARIRL